MSPNETRTLWISVAAGLFAIFLMYSYSQEKQAEYHRKYGALRNVVVATKLIQEMSTIDQSMLTTKEVPAEFVDPLAVDDPDLLIGQVAAAPIAEGETILKNKLLEPGPLTGLSIQVAPNKRAVAIPIDENRGVAKLLKPGDRVDIVTAVDVGKGQTQQRIVKTLMQDVVILAVGKRVVNSIPRLLVEGADKDKRQYQNLTVDYDFSNITIEATPKEAQDIIAILVTSPGNIYLTLRNPNDRKITNTGLSTMETVVGHSAPSAPPARRRRTPSMSGN